MSAVRLLAPALIAGLLTPTPAVAQSGTEIVVNIAAGRLDVLQGGERVRSYPVSVGLPQHATPTRSAEIRRLVWNPTWTPPDVAWARDERPAAPGWSNPMGRVKMHLFEDYYIHGTPRGNEGRLGRPASHGCIRMRNQDVMELARLVMRADGVPVDDATVQALVRTPARTREIALRGRVRVRIEYRLAEMDEHSVTLLPDVYGRAQGTYSQRVRDDLRALGGELDPMLAALQATGSALRFARMDVVRTPRETVGLIASPAERIVMRTRPLEPAAPREAAGM